MVAFGQALGAFKLHNDYIIFFLISNFLAAGDKETDRLDAAIASYPAAGLVTGTKAAYRTRPYKELFWSFVFVRTLFRFQRLCLQCVDTQPSQREEDS